MRIWASDLKQIKVKTGYNKQVLVCIDVALVGIVRYSWHGSDQYEFKDLFQNVY